MCRGTLEAPRLDQLSDALNSATAYFNREGFEVSAITLTEWAGMPDDMRITEFASAHGPVKIVWEKEKK